MRLILEGPDGAGKTTLFNILKYQFQHSLEHAGGPPKSMAEYIERRNIRTNALNSFKDVIADRHPTVSEFVYGPCLRQNNYSHSLAVKQLAKQFKILILLPPIEELRPHALETKPHKSQGQVRAVQEKYDCIYKRYAKLPGKIHFLRHRVDLNKTVREIYEEILCAVF